MKITTILKKSSLLLTIAILILSTVISATNIENKIHENTSIIEPMGIILSEGFEDGTMPPPGGWYTIDNNPTYNWEIVDNATYPDFVHSGDYAGWVNYDSGNQSDEWLVSPDIDLTGLDEVTLIFWAESDTNWSGATVELHIRGDGFDDVIWDMIKDESWDDFIYREMTFDLSNYVCQIIICCSIIICNYQFNCIITRYQFYKIYCLTPSSLLN